MEQKSILAAVARTLEKEFYAKEDVRLLEKLRKKEKREALRELVQVEDDAFLERLIELGISPETVLALKLVPLLAVAWADGILDKREREATIKAARQMRKTTLDWALAVAESSGGFLGLISKVSPAERAVIKEVENVLRVS
jgi:hypothetical protein